VIKQFFVLLCVVFINLGLMAGVSAADFAAREDIGKYFAGFTGAFVMYDEANDRYIVFNETQSVKPLPPCSTFKIYNSLIALETGVLDTEDANTLIKWNGIQYSFEAWNRDQTLASATRNSVVWYFQEVASRIGSELMQEYIDKIKYGNRDISGGVTEFWLRSSLQISAREQVDLMKRLYTGQLPFAEKHVAIVKTNITQSKTGNTWFTGKTGSARQGGRAVVGWFIGCVEKQGNRYFFATNIEAQDGADSGKAREITKSILKDLRVLSD
jgi:bla regulator protein BlaR1